MGQFLNIWGLTIPALCLWRFIHPGGYFFYKKKKEKIPALVPYWWKIGGEKASYPLRVSCPLRRTRCWTSPSGFPLKRLACRPPSPWACTAWKDAQHMAAHPSTTLATVQAPISLCRAACESLLLTLTLSDGLDTSDLHLSSPLPLQGDSWGVMERRMGVK